MVDDSVEKTPEKSGSDFFVLFICTKIVIGADPVGERDQFVATEISLPTIAGHRGRLVPFEFEEVGLLVPERFLGLVETASHPSWNAGYRFELENARHDFVGPGPDLGIFGDGVAMGIRCEKNGGMPRAILLVADQGLFFSRRGKDDVLHDRAFVPMIATHERIKHVDAYMQRVGALWKGIDGLGVSSTL